MQAIQALLSPHAAVFRDGERRTIDAEQLVPGYIVFVEAGDRMPADLRLLDVSNLQVQEAVLTGESVPVDKSIEPARADAALGDRTSMGFSGTIATAGQATGVVVDIGETTQIGRISGLIADIDRLETPLLTQINVFAKWLTVLILIIGAALVAFGVFIRQADFSETFMSVVGLSVAAIPEGLPAVLTITMAIGVRAMADKNAIVRRLPAIETLGAVSVICTDKTGTLTRNEMMVASVYAAGAMFNVSGEGYAPIGELSLDCSSDEKARADLRELAAAAALCNDASLVNEDGNWTVSGDPMEGALIALSRKILDAEGEPDYPAPRRGVLPFDARHRFMATQNATRDGLRVYAKGAPEVIAGLCRDMVGPDGARLSINAHEISSKIDTLAAKGQRVLALAVADSVTDEALTPDRLQGRLTFLGLVGLVDPPRAESVAAVAATQAAGISVKMITGDHAGTAVAIAKEIGLQHPERVLTGEDLDQTDDAELATAALNTSVFARTSPEDKLRLVKALQSQNMIVAMTGDGVN
ncbi:MAG: HAD-IC family P-type ATPase, partial [Pseudomonadota bacterium]